MLTTQTYRPPASPVVEIVEVSSSIALGVGGGGVGGKRVLDCCD